MNGNLRAFLSQAYRCEEQIQLKQEQIRRLRDLAESITVTLSPAPGSGNRRGSRVERYALEILERQKELEKAIDDLLKAQREIVTAIEKVSSPVKRELLTRRYLNNMSWEAIAVTMNYSYRWVLALHGQALAELQKKAL